jgi:hypothetical protein
MTKLRGKVLGRRESFPELSTLFLCLLHHFPSAWPLPKEHGLPEFRGEKAKVITNQVAQLR